jgi:hypothetical protein
MESRITKWNDGMGYGDELIGSGLARGAFARGKRVAFGDGTRIRWRPQAHEIYAGNPNVAPPGSEGAPDLEWVPYYSGHRMYGEVVIDRWVFHDFRCPPGELFFSADEIAYACAIRCPNLVVIEPRTKEMGACVGVNKQWPQDRYLEVARDLALDGYTPVCLGPPGVRGWTDLPVIHTPTFRHAVALMGAALLYVGPEGGLHHGAAAADTQAIVIFGGFNSPRSTGYPWHTNLTAGGEPCGRINPCKHCRKAMDSITVADVLAHARRILAQVQESGYAPRRTN